MAALTAAVELDVQGVPDKIAVEAAASTTYYKGAMLVADASGYAGAPTDTAALIPLGVYSGEAEAGVKDRAYVVAASAHPKLVIERGLIWIPLSGASQASVGAKFYIADTGAPTATAGSKTYALPCVGWKSGYVLLDFRAPIKMA